MYITITTPWKVLKSIDKHKSLTNEQAQELYKKVLWHKLKYITRATFTVYNKELAKKLKNFRNSSTWGNFRELSYEEVETMAKQREAHSKKVKGLVLLEAGHCPICGGAIRWRGGLYPGSLSYYGKEIGDGYYHLPIKVRGSPMKLPSKKKLEEVKHYRLLLYEQAMNGNKWQERKDIYG